MKGSILSALALICTITSLHGQNLSADDLARRTLERRAVEAVIWGMPAVNTDLMYQATLKLGGKPNQIVYWSSLLDWRNQTLTPNPDVIYFMAFYNTKDGPVVIEVPPADDGVINGSIMDPWQAALEDVGPAGVDKGAGGKYLILPPGYNEKVPDGYITLPSANYQGYALLRSILKSGGDADVKAAVAYGKRIKIYPLSQAANSPETVFIDAIGAAYEDTQRILNAAAAEAHAWLDLKYETMFSPYYEGRRWVFPIAPDVIGGLQTQFANPDSYPVDGRGVTYTMAFFSTKHSGIGQYYLMTLRDQAGQSLA